MTMTPAECTTCAPLLHAFADRLDVTAGEVAALRQDVHDVKTHRDAPQIAQAMLHDLDLEDQVTCLMHAERPTQWCTPEAIRCLAQAWPDARKRALLCAAARKSGLSPRSLEEMVQQWHGEGDSLDLTTISGTTLLQTNYAQRQEVVTGVLPAGCTLLAGNAKEGKSLLAYHLAACVASGRPFLGQFPVVQGQVLFFALEDGEMRGKARLEMQRQQLGLPDTDLGGVQFRFWDAPRLGAGLEQFIERWIATKPDTRLIVIDILEKIRPRGNGWQDLYQEGYQATAPLARLAQENNIALLVVHHSTKNPHSDPRLRVSGPMSLLGGADNAWLLSRPYGETAAALSIAGRDLAEQEWALRFAQGLWSLEGPLKAWRLSRERQEVLEVLAEEPAGLRPYQLAQALGKNPSTTRSLLKKMRADGEVTLEEGLYRAGVHTVHAVGPDSVPPEPVLAVDTSQREDTSSQENRSNTANSGDSRRRSGDSRNRGNRRDRANREDMEHPANRDDAGNTMDTCNSVDSVDRMDAAHSEDRSNTTDAVDAANKGHRGNSVDRGDTPNSLDAGNSVDRSDTPHREDSGNTPHREDSSNGVDRLEEDDPFLAPDPYTSLPLVPVGEEEPLKRDSPAQESITTPVSTPAQASPPVPAQRDPDATGSGARAGPLQDRHPLRYHPQRPRGGPLEVPRAGAPEGPTLQVGDVVQGYLPDGAVYPSIRGTITALYTGAADLPMATIRIADKKDTPWRVDLCRRLTSTEDVSP